MIQDDMKTGWDMCEEEENYANQSVGGVCFYNEVTREMLDPSLVKEAEAEELRRFRKMQVFDYEDRQTDRQTETDRDRQRQTETDRDRQRQTETDRDRQRQTETDRDRQRQTETDRDRQRQTETDRDRQRQTETDRDRQRQTETDRDRQRQTETDRDRVLGLCTLRCARKVKSLP